MENDKQFIFLYPIRGIFNWELEYRSEEFKSRYKKLLNECIDIRYRKKGFKINYAIFDDKKVSSIIKLKNRDNIIKVGLSFEKHCKEKIYPDNDFILNQLGKLDKLIIAGFHSWDCVDKLAEKAYRRGINTLVDEDLTEFFIGRIYEIEFKVDEYPTYNPKKLGSLFEVFMENRKNKPWLYQNY